MSTRIICDRGEKRRRSFFLLFLDLRGFFCQASKNESFVEKQTKLNVFCLSALQWLVFTLKSDCSTVQFARLAAFIYRLVTQTCTFAFRIKDGSTGAHEKVMLGLLPDENTCRVYSLRPSRLNVAKGFRGERCVSWMDTMMASSRELVPWAFLCWVYSYSPIVLFCLWVFLNNISPSGVLLNWILVDLCSLSPHSCFASAGFWNPALQIHLYFISYSDLMY